MAQNMKLSIISQSGQNVVVDVNVDETFEEFQEKLIKQHNLYITVEEFQLFFANLSSTDNLYNCLKENLDIGDELNNVEDPPIYEINLIRDLNTHIKQEQSNSFESEMGIREQFDAYKEVQNIDSSIIVMNQEQDQEYGNILNENIFEKTSEPDQNITLYSVTNDYQFVESQTEKTNETIENKQMNDVALNTTELPNSVENKGQNKQKYSYMDIESKLAEIHDCSEENINNFCRLCAKSIIEENKIQIYDEDNQTDKLEEKINGLLPITIKKKDGLPQQICNSCIDNLKNSCKFFKIVVEADKELRSKFLSSANKNGGLNNSTVSEFMSEFLNSTSKSPNDQLKNVKVEPEDSDNNENDFETEYLETEEIQNGAIINKQNCRRCDLNLQNLEESINHSIKLHHINDLFACVFCDLGFNQTITLAHHIKVEHRDLFSEETRKYQCIVCSKKYSSQYLLQKHTCVKSSANKSLHCEVCNQAFPTKVRLNFHRQFHLKDARPLFCTVCSITFDDENEFFDHVNFKHDSKQIFSCDICEKNFSIRAALNNHKKMHSGVRNHKCEICDKSFLDKQTLKEHEVIHMDTKPYQCHFCGKNLNRLSRLRRHLLTHESNPVVNDIHVCNLCKEVFGDEQIAKYHETSHENKNCIEIISTDKVFRCEFCEKCFSTPEALNKHRSSHSGSTPYICHICKAHFSSYSRCTTHKTTHGLYKDGAEKEHFPVVKHFLCDICEKSYLHWSYLGHHRRLKHSEHVYKCDKCDLEFFNTWGLAYHRKTKHPQEMFKCNDCGKILSNEQSLKLHRITKHSDRKTKDVQVEGIKEYKCSLCPKSFVQLSALVSHIKLHKQRRFVYPSKVESNPKPTQNNNERPFTCDICGLSFRRQFTLRNHKLKHNTPSESGSFILMVDMKEDDQSEKKSQETIETVVENKTTQPEMNYVQLASNQEMIGNYIDIGNGNYLQVQGNTFNFGGKEYILIDENGKTAERNEEFEMIVDETLQEEPVNQNNLVVPQQFENNTVMLVESENNSYVINQNDMHSDYVYAATDKTVAKTVTAGGTTYIIGENNFLLQPDNQSF